MRPWRLPRELLRDLLLYTAIFAVLGWSWLAHLRDAVPLDDAPADGWLILWVLDWCWHALTTAPRALFDPPINHPAPAQLAGSEHFLSSQILFGPIRWLTGHSVVAANLTAFLCYPLAATAMAALLRALRVSSGPAFVAGLLYGFGFTAAPGRLHILQTQHLYFPLVVLAVHRLRERPRLGRWMALVAVLCAALFSSYYMATYVTIATALWAAGELLRTGTGRARFATAVATAWVLAAALLVAVSRPYFARPEAHGDPDLTSSRWGAQHLDPTRGPDDPMTVGAQDLVLQTGRCLLVSGRPELCFTPLSMWRDPRSAALLWRCVDPVVVGSVPLLLVALAVTLRRRRREPEALAALAIAIAGILLAGAAYGRVAGLEIPLPRTLLSWTPARMIRTPVRALAMTFFGTVVLVAYGLESLRRRHLVAGRMAAASLLALAPVHFGVWIWDAQYASAEDREATMARWVRFAPTAFELTPTLTRDRDVYRRVAEHVERAGGGPFLEWPSAIDSASAMVGQTVHRQPSIGFYSGYLPPHVELVQALLAQLPGHDALDDLVDMTGLTWILVRPAAEWKQPERYGPGVDELKRHPRTRDVTAFGEFLLVQLDPTSRHPRWFDAVAEGPRAGRTVLGTALAPVPREAVTFEISTQFPRTVRVGFPFFATLGVSNRGSVDLPAALPGRGGRAFTARFEIRWQAVDRPGEEAHAPQLVELRRDVPAMESIEQNVLVGPPRRPGPYAVQVSLRQVDGTDLTGPHNPVRVGVDVLP
ncbi:MAG: hypothetical protein ACREQL_03540 [Candidatus Binatia bacterium]